MNETTIEQRIRQSMADTAASLGKIDPPAEPQLRSYLVPDEQRTTARFGTWLGVAAAVLVLGAVGAIVLTAGPHIPDDPSPVITAPEEEIEDGEAVDTTATMEDPALLIEEWSPRSETPPATGTWQWTWPERDLALQRIPVDAPAPPIGLADGVYIGIVDRVGVDGEHGVLRFSRGYYDESVHDDPELYDSPPSGFFPDFDLPVLIPFDPNTLLITMVPNEPRVVPLDLFLSAADGDLRLLPYAWTGHALVRIEDGAVTRLENWYTA